MKRVFRLILIIALAACAAGCIAARLHHDGMELVKAGKVEAGLTKLAQAVEKAPTNPVYRRDYLVERDSQLSALLATGAAQETAERWDDAKESFGRARTIAPTDPRPADALGELARAREVAVSLSQARIYLRHDDLEHARSLVGSALAIDPANHNAKDLLAQIEASRTKDQIENPVLQSAPGKLVTLRFSNASVRMILEAIGRSAGITVMIDQDIRADMLSSVTVERVPAEDAINFVMQANHLRSKVLDPATVLIYPATPEKIRDYEDLVVKGFYLGDADAKRTEALLKGFLKSEDIFVDEKRNLVVIRGPVEQIKLAEKLVALDDVKQPEVMLEVQVMEINRSRLTELGIVYPNQATLSRTASSAGGTTLADYMHINPSLISAVIPSTTVNLNRSLTDADLLANPRIRVRNLEHAKVLIGEKLPVVTSTATSTGFVSENIQYLDVGLKLEVEPNISLDDSVSINLNLEVSSVSNQITTPGGSLAYEIGTRTASTVLELKDGETEVLAGLISDNDTRTAQNIPGIGDLPILGRLFSDHKNDHEKSEVVLAITPHIVRGYRPSVVDDSKFWAGTANRPRTQPFVLHHGNAASAAASPAGDNPVPTHPVATETVSATSAAPEPNNATALTFDWKGPKTVKVGETFVVLLHTKTDGLIQSLPLQITYDRSAMEVVEVHEGGFFRSPNATTLFASHVDQAAAKVMVSTASSKSEGTAGEGDLIAITLKAVAAKSGALIGLSAVAPLRPDGQPAKASLPESYTVKIVE